jgi:MoaA/NifB/PqqE/SkfB family radical SAM enzyme
MDVVNEKGKNKILPYVKEIENGTIRGPISLHILITDFCVNKCNMCLHWATEKKKILPLETIEKIWKEMNENYGESICLTGGDPVRHPQFNELLAISRKFDLGFVNTGNYQKDFDWELLHDVKWIRYSVDSLDTDLYKKIRARNNLHTEVIPNIKRSQNYVKQIGVNFTIQQMNAHEIEDVLRWAADDMGLYRLILYPMHGDAVLGLTKEQEKDLLGTLYKNRKYWEQIPENNAEFLIESLSKSIEDQEHDVRQLAFNLDAHPCMINKIHLSIGPDGRVFPCEVIADDTDAYGPRKMWVQYIHDENNEYDRVNEIEVVDNIGNINEESLVEIWERNFTNSFRADKCSRCWARYQPVINAYHESLGKKTFI